MDSTTFSPVASLDFLPSISDGVLLTFYLIAAFYLVFTAVFYYHWNQYGTDTKVTLLTAILYLITTVPLLLIAGSFTLAM